MVTFQLLCNVLEWCKSVQLPHWKIGSFCRPDCEPSGVGLLSLRVAIMVLGDQIYLCLPLTSIAWDMNVLDMAMFEHVIDQRGESGWVGRAM